MSQDQPASAPAFSVTAGDGIIEAPAAVTGCWGNTGVYGDGSCLELQKFIHCRNCPVYSAAGGQLIDRPLPPNYRQEWTQHFAEEKKLPDSGNASAVLFRIEGEWLALPTRSFQEIAEKRPIHSLPHRPEGIVLGLANVRGELVICISLGHLLQVERMPSLESLRLNYRRLLVVQGESSRLAFPVEEVHGPYRFHPQELQSPPSTVARANARFAQGVLRWQTHTAGLLDTDLLFSGLNRCLA